MKYVRVSVEPPADVTPAFFDALARSPAVTEARLQDWNFVPGSGGEPGTATELFEIDGDAGAFASEATDSRGVERVDTNRVGDGRFAALVVLATDAVPLLSDLFQTLARAGVVPVTPVVYREGRVTARIVGASGALQDALDAFPDPIPLAVDAVGEFDRRRERPTAGLSERQREAVLAASDLGYYEHPRRATHEDVAAALGCAPNTASEHLQKAESKLFSNVLEFAGRR